MPAKKRTSEKVVESKKNQKKQKVIEKSPVEIAVEKLTEAVDIYDFSCDELFKPMVPVLFSTLVEERTEIHRNCIDLFGRAMGEAKTVLLGQKETLEWEVNNTDQDKINKYNTLQTLESEQETIKAEKTQLDTEETEANEAEKTALELFEEEQGKVEELEREYAALEGKKAFIKNIVEQHFEPGLTMGKDVAKPAKEKAKKAFNSLIKETSQWKDEETLIVSLQHALFTDITERTEFERYVVQKVDEKFRADDAEFDAKIAGEKPSHEQEQALEADHKAKTATREAIEQRIEENVANKKRTDAEIKKILKEIDNFPKELEKKTNALEGLNERIADFVKDVEGNFAFCKDRTDIVEEVAEEEAVLEEEEKAEEPVEMEVETAEAEEEMVTEQEEGQQLCDNVTTTIEVEDVKPAVVETEHEEVRPEDVAETSIITS